MKNKVIFASKFPENILIIVYSLLFFHVSFALYFSYLLKRFNNYDNASCLEDFITHLKGVKKLHL